jgi:DNA-binding MarR family transcriptional regulator
MEVMMMKSELYEKLTRLQWLLHKQQIRGYQGGGLLADTTRGQGRILAALQMKDGLSTKDLSYLLGLAVSSLNEFLGKLEKGGYITREPSEKDKRVMLVKLTEKGKSEEQPASVDFGDIFDCLSEEEQAALGDYLDRIIVALQAKLGFDDEEADERLRERLRAAQEGRERLFGERFGGFGRFGSFGYRHGFGFPNGRNGRESDDGDGK